MLSSLIEIKSPEEIEVMREGARLTLDIISTVRDQIRVGMSTAQVDQLIEKEIKARNTTAAFLNYQPDPNRAAFPGHACLCLNNEVFHGIGKSERTISKGDLLTIDMGLLHKGLYSDCADTFLIGDTNTDKLRLIRTCKDAIKNALPLCVPGGNIQEITKSIDKTIRKAGFFPAENYGGHSIGSSLHMAPFISNSMSKSTDLELPENLVICLEPAVLTASCGLATLEDYWTVAAPAHILSAHVERMVQIRPGCGEILK